MTPEEKMHELATKVALARELAQDSWWMMNDVEGVINSFIDFQFKEMGKLVWDQLAAKDEPKL